MQIPDAGANNIAASDTVARVTNAVNTMTSQSTSQMSQQMGVSMTSVVTATRTGVSAIFIVAPPPPVAPPPVYVQCGCDHLRDGAMYGQVVCVKEEAGHKVCRGLSEAQGCPSDMMPCFNGGYACRDTNPRKCARKSRKGKCHKRRLQRKKCKLTCGRCRYA